MATKRNPADAALEYFQTADLREAGAVLALCQGTLKRRGKAAPAAVVHEAREGARRPARRSREVGPGEVSTPEGGAPGEPAGPLSTRSESGS